MDLLDVYQTSMTGPNVADHVLGASVADDVAHAVTLIADYLDVAPAVAEEASG